MTEANYIATAARSGKPFTFTRIRGGATQRFLPGEGTRLHFANRATDTLEVVGVPSGFLTAGDVVTVAYLGTTVFRGEVETYTNFEGRGDDATQSVTVTGPWAKMARLVFRQSWRTGASGSSLSSRLILNQATDGTGQTLNVSLAEIAWGANNTAPAACGYQIVTNSINVSTVKLPFDETRDITIANAIVRQLKYFPSAGVWFDYSTTTPTIYIRRPNLSGNNASYVAAVPKTARRYTYNAHPITGVDLEIETVSEVDGVSYRNITHQTAGNTSADNPNCLYATLQLAGFSSSSVKQSFKAVSETIPTTFNVAGWWKAKHPRLADVADEAISITNSVRSGASDNVSDYPYISGNTIGDIQAAGLKARVETFTCDCKITTADDQEENIKLQMQFVTTNAVNGRTYTWVAESSATSGETVANNLASTLLATRSVALKEERFTMRLGTAAQWPKIGDLCDHLLLQEFDVDCTELTAELHFGTPDYLSPDDMAGLLSGFRNKRRATLSTSRVSGKLEDDSESDVDMGGVMPLSSTEFAPGVKAKTTFKSVSGGNNTGSMVVDATGASPRQQMNAVSQAKIDLNTADLPASDEIKIRQLVLVAKDGSRSLLHIPMCRGVTIDFKNGKITTGDGGSGGDGGGGDIPIPEGGGGSGGGGMFAWDEDTTTMGPGGVMVGRLFVSASGTGVKSDGTYSVKVTFTPSNGNVTAEVVSGVAFGTAPTSTICYIPIYIISSGKISQDMRGAFVVPAYE